MYKKRLLIGFLTAFLFITVSCELDQCDPPFSVGSGLSGVLDQGPVKAGKDFGFVIGMFATSVTNLDDVEIIVAFPNEIEVESITQPKGGPDVIRHNQTIKWTGRRKQTFFGSLFERQWQEHFTVWLKSKTDWEKWSKPITMHISLDFKVEGRRECSNYPNGFYSKTITWSHEGYFDPLAGYNPPGWDVAPNGYGGVWK